MNADYNVRGTLAYIFPTKKINNTFEQYFILKTQALNKDDIDKYVKFKLENDLYEYRIVEALKTESEHHTLPVQTYNRYMRDDTVYEHYLYDKKFCTKIYLNSLIDIDFEITIDCHSFNADKDYSEINNILLVKKISIVDSNQFESYKFSVNSLL